MNRNLKRRVRALIWAIVGTASGLAVGARVFGQDEALDRARAMTEKMFSEQHRLLQQYKEQLEQQETGRNWSALLAHKATVDSAFAPLHLIRDAMESLTDGSQGVDLLRSLRTEWRDAPVTAQWSHPDGAERARRALAAWVPVPLAAEQQALHVEVRTGSEAWVGTDAPPMIAWTIDATWDSAGPKLHARSWWRIPLAEPVRIDFPLAVEGLDIWLNSSGARLQDDRGAAHAESWVPNPLFNNPPTLYAVFDALRLIRAKDSAVTTQSDAPSSDDAAPSPTVRTRVIRRADGSVVRSERWTWEDDALRSVVIEQAPVRLVHHSEQGVELITEVEGVENSRTPHRAHSEIVQFAAGARIEISFRIADPIRDRVASSNASVPDRLVLTVGGQSRAWVDFLSVRLGKASDPDGWCAERDSRLAATATAHAALNAQVAAAIAMTASNDVARILETIDAQHASCGAPYIQRMAEWELAAVHMLDVGMDHACDEILAARWLPDIEHRDAVSAVRRWQAAGHARFALLLSNFGGVKPEELTSTDAADDGSDELWKDSDESNGDDPAGAAGVAGVAAAPCDNALLQSGARVLYDEVQIVVMSTVRDQRLQATLLANLCRACTEHRDDLRKVDDVRVSAIARDARVFLASAFRDGARVPEPRNYCKKFADDTVSIAIHGLASDESIAVVRTGWDIYAHAAVAALQRAQRAARVMARSAGTSGSESSGPDDESNRTSTDRATCVAVKRELDVYRALVGNAYHPETLVSKDLALPSATEVSQAMDSAIAVVVTRERERASVIGSILGKELGAAREQAAYRRTGEMAVASAVTMFSEWCLSEGRSSPRPAP
ncbi:MAG: hypothetical protein RIR77_1308 [Planctomycetota bacterium]